MELKYSPYFTFMELTDSTSHPELVEKNREDAIKYQNSGMKLSILLESIRHVLGDKPLKVDSGFRNEALNLAVGSKAINSKHTLFEACDIVPSGMSIKEAFAALMVAHKDGLLPDLRKVLQEGSWLHCEVSTSVGDYRGFFVSKDGNITFEKVA
jgi:hypothetical protein